MLSNWALTNHFFNQSLYGRIRVVSVFKIQFWMLIVGYQLVSKTKHILWCVFHLFKYYGEVIFKNQNNQHAMHLETCGLFTKYNETIYLCKLQTHLKNNICSFHRPWCPFKNIKCQQTTNHHEHHTKDSKTIHTFPISNTDYYMSKCLPPTK